MSLLGPQGQVSEQQPMYEDGGSGGWKTSPLGDAGAQCGVQ